MFAASKSAQATGGAPPPPTTTTDPQFPYVTALLTGDGTSGAQNNTFVDSSPNAFAITRNGNTTQGSASPYGGNWSNYFDGSSYLTVPAGTAFAPLTGNFTVEGWINPSSLMSGYGMIYGQTYSGANYFTIFATDGTVKFINNSGTWSSGANLWTVGSWNHFAVVRNGGSTRVYLNGVGGTAAADAYNYTEVTVLPTIGRYTHTGSNFYFGYISNLRYVKGTAVYTANFTPSTTPLTAITNTSLLTCQSPRFVDNSINNFTVTNNGNTSVQVFSPFEPATLTPISYSGYLDGNGDYLSIPANTAFTFGTNDHTIEFYYYLPSTSLAGAYATQWKYSSASTQQATNDYYFQIGTAGGSNIGLLLGGGGSWGILIQPSVSINAFVGVWTHIAWTRSGNTFRLFFNGVQVGTGTYAGSISAQSNPMLLGQEGAGSYAGGYYSNFRVNNGTAVYTANFTPPTAPLTAITNTSLLTCQSNTFVDNSPNNFAITPFGDAKTAIQNPFGTTSALTTGYNPSVNGGSMYFDGNGDYLVTPNNSALALATNASDFTIDCWVNNGGFSGSQYGRGICVYYPQASYGSNRLMFRLSNGVNRINLYLLDSSGAQFGNSGADGAAIIPVGVWTHLALVRRSGVFYVYVNGLIDITVSSSSAPASIPFTSYNIMDVGRTQDGGVPDFFGSISNFRFVKGIAVYTSNFVPPVAPTTAISGTSLLLNGTNGGIIDNAMMNDYETVGNAQISTSVKKYGTGSMYFDGTGDYLKSTSTLAMALGTTFTIECWVYILGYGSGGNCILDVRTSNTVGQAWIAASGIAYFQTTGTGTLAEKSGITTNTWTHIAYVSDSTSSRVYVNGSNTGGVNQGQAQWPTTAQVGFIGADFGGGTNFNGYIDDYRISKYARYVANFTPPTQAFPTY